MNNKQGKVSTVTFRVILYVCGLRLPELKFIPVLLRALNVSNAEMLPSSLDKVG